MKQLIEKGKGITINTDASFHLDHKVGGYAFYIVSNLFRIQKGGMFKSHPKCPTHAEVFCIGNAIATLLAQKELPKCDWLIINTDATNAIKWITKGDQSPGKEVKALWLQLITRLESKTNEFRHVKAHSGKNDSRSYVNEWCDTVAKKYMRMAVTAHLKKVTAKEKESVVAKEKGFFKRLGEVLRQ